MRAGCRTKGELAVLVQRVGAKGREVLMGGDDQRLGLPRVEVTSQRLAQLSMAARSVDIESATDLRKETEATIDQRVLSSAKMSSSF